MTKRNDYWTPEEDAIVIQTIKDVVVGEGKPYSEACRAAEEKLPKRNTGSIYARWKQTLSPKYPEITEKYRGGSNLTSWTPEEDYKVVEAVLEKTAKGETLQTIYKYLETILTNRTYDAIGFRWSSVLKKTFFDEYEDAKRKAGKASYGTYKGKKRTGKSKTKKKEKKVETAAIETQTPEVSLFDVLPQNGETISVADLNVFNEEPVNSIITSQPKIEVIYKETPSVVSSQDFQDVAEFITKVTTLIEENKKLVQEIESYKELKDENERLRAKVAKLEREADTAQSDYKAVLGLMEKARKLMLDEEETKNHVQSQTPKFKMDRNGNLERM